MNDLINRKDLEKIIYDWLSLSKNYHFSTASISLQDLFNIIEHMSSVNQWIPCSERLPEEEKKDYLVCTDGGYQCQCRWTNINHFWTDLTTDWHWHIADVPQYSKVVAWMPLPEPWKGEEE